MQDCTEVKQADKRLRLSSKSSIREESVDGLRKSLVKRYETAAWKTWVGDRRLFFSTHG